VTIASTSMGAITGGVCASEMMGESIGTHMLRVLGNRPDVMSKFLRRGSDALPTSRVAAITLGERVKAHGAA
jgi:hypothetical protein